jgi:soluble lytic murein transglycosylase-like protein
MPALQGPLLDLSPVNPEEAPGLSNAELQENQQEFHFDETEGMYFGQHAPKLRSFLRLSGKKKIQKQVEKAAMEIGVDPRLAKAMAAVESGYDQKAVSPQGAIGVLQLMPRFFCRDSEITPEMLFDPDVNIRVGLTHFKSLLDKFNDNVDLSLAAYNAGAQRVIEAGHMIPPFEQTQNFIRKVKQAMDEEDLAWSSPDQS